VFQNKCIFIRSKKSDDANYPDTKYKDDNLKALVAVDLEENWTMVNLMSNYHIECHQRERDQPRNPYNDDDVVFDDDSQNSDMSEYNNWMYQDRLSKHFVLDVLVVVKDQENRLIPRNRNQKLLLMETLTMMKNRRRRRRRR